MFSLELTQEEISIIGAALYSHRTVLMNSRSLLDPVTRDIRLEKIQHIEALIERLPGDNE